MKDQLLSYDDIILIPQRSDLISRFDADTSAGPLHGHTLRMPIISANMETVTGVKMALEMWLSGCVGALHRFWSISDNCNAYRAVVDAPIVNADCIVSVGVGDEGRRRALALHTAGARMFIIDIAHGHSSAMEAMLKWMRDRWGDDVYIIAGNIATADAVRDLQKFGADCLKVGIGPGAVCTTRIVTGHGVPQFSALLDCSSVARIPIIADGGIRSSGDIAKALVCADFVMLGSMLAGTNESPGAIVDGMKVHRGSASYERAGIAEEGIVTNVPIKGSVSTLITNLAAGLRSAMSYTGARTLVEFSRKAKWARQTNHSYLEGTSHIQRGWL